MDHFWFITGSYLISAIVLLGLVAWVTLDGRSLTKRLRDLEARGIRRRSEAGTAPRK